MEVTLVTGNGILFDKQLPLPLATMPFYCRCNFYGTSYFTVHKSHTVPKKSMVNYGLKTVVLGYGTTMWLHQGTTITMLFYHVVRGSRLADKNFSRLAAIFLVA